MDTSPHPPPTRTRKILRPPTGREQLFIEIQRMHKELLVHMDFFRSTRVREMEIREREHELRNKIHEEQIKSQRTLNRREENDDA